MTNQGALRLLEGVLLLVCLSLQITIAIVLLGKPRTLVVSPSKAAVEDPPPVCEENTHAKLGRTGMSVDRKTHRIDRQILGQKRLLNHLLSREDFLEWSGRELEVMAAYRSETNDDLSRYLLTVIDTDAADWRSSLGQALEARQNRFDAANQTLDLIAKEDYSGIADEDFDSFALYLEAVSRWVNCMYDEQVSPEERAAALRQYNEVANEYRNRVWTSGKGNPLRTNFLENHGAQLKQYQMLRVQMQLDDLWEYGQIHGTNSYYFKKYDPELQAYRHYMVQLEEEDVLPSEDTSYFDEDPLSPEELF